jgi:prephenate dehydrogenase
MGVIDAPRIGIIGAGGSYGRWLTTFFQNRMGLTVLGHDPALPESPSARDVRDASDVLLFAVPIRHTATIIEALAADMPARANAPLWIDITSVKQAPVAAMQRAPVEVLGLHPMTAPPKSPTLKGRVMVVCEARVERWQSFVAQLLEALQAQCVRCSPEEHDAIMARVQALVHAGTLAMASVLGEDAPPLGPPAALLPFRSPIFELVNATMTRILANNPAIYEDIQFGSAAVAPLVTRLAERMGELAKLVVQGDDAARRQFRERFLTASREAFGAAPLAEGNAGFERLAYLLADLAEPRYLSIHLPDDQPGALRRVLAAFEECGTSIESIHSSRTPQGQVHFRIGFGREQDAAAIADAAAALQQRGIGVVLDYRVSGASP